MNRVFGILMCFVLLAGTALPVLAQTSRRNYAGRTTRYERYGNSQQVYRQRRSSRNRSFWTRHRDVLTLAAGTGAGAAVGGLTGGKKGAIIGALVGAGGSALYTYKLRDRNNERRYARGRR